jgi:hypothetical protein
MSPLLSAAPTHERPTTGTPLVLPSDGIADQLPLGRGVTLPYWDRVAAEQVIGDTLEHRQAARHGDPVTRSCHGVPLAPCRSVTALRCVRDAA